MSEWTRSEVQALAQVGCLHCFGIGFELGRLASRGVQPCNCVLRRVFTICRARFRRCADYEGIIRVRQEIGSGSMWSVKDAEYVADFCNIAKRTLRPGSLGYDIFQMHFLMGAEWKVCVRKLNLTRWLFWHEVYSIQQQLGRAFKTTEPYALFPPGNYFAPRNRGLSRAA